jgi:L-2-hydroxyglutarate oxidase LhgO
LAYEYLDQKDISYKKCSKLIVAVDEGKVPSLRLPKNCPLLYWEKPPKFKEHCKRAQLNNCRNISMVDRAKIHEIEPKCRVTFIN